MKSNPEQPGRSKQGNDSPKLPTASNQAASKPATGTLAASILQLNIDASLSSQDITAPDPSGDTVVVAAASLAPLLPDLTVDELFRRAYAFAKRGLEISQVIQQEKSDVVANKITEDLFAPYISLDQIIEEKLLPKAQGEKATSAGLKTEKGILLSLQQFLKACPLTEHEKDIMKVKSDDEFIETVKTSKQIPTFIFAKFKHWKEKGHLTVQDYYNFGGWGEAPKAPPKSCEEKK